MVIQQCSKQSFQPHHPGVSETPRLDFFLKNNYWENAKFQCKKKATIHSHRDLNSVSSSTDKTNLLGPIPSRLRSPTPRASIPPRATVSSDGDMMRLKTLFRALLDQHDRGITQRGIKYSSKASVVW